MARYPDDRRGSLLRRDDRFGSKPYCRLTMPEVVKTFAVTPSAFRSEILDAFAKAPKPIRRIEVIMTDDYKRRTRAWQIDDFPYDDALREVCEFVEDAIGNGMSEGKISLTSD